MNSLDYSYVEENVRFVYLSEHAPFIDWVKKIQRELSEDLLLENFTEQQLGSLIHSDVLKSFPMEDYQLYLLGRRERVACILNWFKYQDPELIIHDMEALVFLEKVFLAIYQNQLSETSKMLDEFAICYVEAINRFKELMSVRSLSPKKPLSLKVSLYFNSLLKRVLNFEI